MGLRGLLSLPGVIRVQRSMGGFPLALDTDDPTSVEEDSR